MTTKYKLLLKNISQLVTITQDKSPFLLKEKMNQPTIITNCHVLVNEQGLIEDILPFDKLSSQLENQSEKVLDCNNCSVIPGLVDSHTHPVWSGDRTEEFALKLSGASYLEIHQRGGGIGFTVKHTRESTFEELRVLLERRLSQMNRLGTTLVEAKSGYGLNCETEMKMLKVIHQTKKHFQNRMDIVSTWLGAHSYPKDMTHEEYENDILENQIPLIKQLKEQDEISPEFADVFLERGVFDYSTTKRILQKAKEIAGLRSNFHGDELNFMKSGELAGEIGATSVSHLEHVSDEGIRVMAEKKVSAVLLPTTAYILRIAYPPARKLIDSGVPVCIASDYNPNAHCMSMPFVMNLSCVQMHMTMNEALVASTLNAAASIGKSSTHGSIEIGKVGDFVVIDNPDWRHIIYELGGESPISHVIKRGVIVHTK